MKNLFSRIESATVRIHIEDQNVGLRFNRLLYPASHQISQRRRDVFSDRDDVDLLLSSGCLNGKKKCKHDAQRQSKRVGQATRLSQRAPRPLKRGGPSVPCSVSTHRVERTPGEGGRAQRG